MTPHRPCVVGFGELVWDVLPHATLPGGAPANFVWHAQQLGAEGVIVTAVGDDPEGRELIAWLTKKELSVDCVQVNSQPTGRVDVHVNAQGEPGYVIHENASWDAIQWEESLKLLARRADCVCFGSLAQRSAVSRDSLNRFLVSTRPECLRVFDVNLRHPMPKAEVVIQSLRLANVLKLNEDEWPFVAQCLGLNTDWPIGTRALLCDSEIKLIAVTRGAKGSVVLSDHQRFELPAEPIEVSDTIGAGDAFSAAVALGSLRGKPLREIQAIASTVSAYVCTQAGATPTLPGNVKAMFSEPAATVRVKRARLPALRQLTSPTTRDRAPDSERTASK